MKLRKNDFVAVTKGKDAGKKGRIIRIFPDRNKALVEGINFVKRHTKSHAKNPQGGIIQKEMPVAVPNLRYFCLKCNQAVRLGFKLTGENKTRYCKKCGEFVENK